MIELVSCVTIERSSYQKADQRLPKYGLPVQFPTPQLDVISVGVEGDWNWYQPHIHIRLLYTP